MESDGIGSRGGPLESDSSGHAGVDAARAEPHAAELLVTGDDSLPSELTPLLAELRPPIHIRFIPREQTRAASIAEGARVEAIVVGVAELDPATLGWLQQLASIRLPIVVVIAAPPAKRSSLRQRCREVGAIDCLLRAELSIPLVEATIAHARSFNRQAAGRGALRQRFALAVRGSRDGMWEYDLVAKRAGYSPRWFELLGLSNAAVSPNLDGWLSRVHPEDVARLRAELRAVVDGHTPLLDSEHRLRDGADAWRWVVARGAVLRDPQGRAVRMAGSLTDVTPYRQREQLLRERSRHDNLTKLPDRRVFLERCARAVELARAHDDYVFVVLLVVIDRLGQIRDSFGIDTADAALALLAKRLRACLRPEDLLFRFSSSKFAILVEDAGDPAFGTVVAKRIHTAVAEPFEVDGTTTFTTVSIGMTSSAHGYERVEEVVADVSAATDSARDRGRNRHEVYETSMRSESRTLLALETALRQALAEDQFELHYQPIVMLEHMRSSSVERDGLLGFEALLRWEHPELGRISPVEFIPIAEDTGLIIPLGRWVLREAVHMLHSLGHSSERPLAISVNLSAKQISDEQLLDTLDAVLAETGLPPTCLKIELTESVLADRVDEVTTFLQQIRARGVQVWVDDFGTGYSSLGYLHRFPVDGLKIDRAFVSELDGTSESETMVRTILSLAENLGLDVVAEGIETEVQAQQLRALGCSWCQGWLFARPQPAAKIRELVG